MGHLPPNHDERKVMAYLHPQNIFLHFMGRLNRNLVFLMVVLLLDGEDFLVCEEIVFMPLPGMPPVEMLCSYTSDFLQS